MKSSVEVVIKAKVSSEVAKWLENQKASRNKGNVTSKALEFFYEYHYYRKGFFIRLIDIHFNEIKHLIRKIGSIRNSM